MKKNRFLSIFASLALVACASNNGSSAAAVNSNCPMNPGEAADMSVTTEYNGQKVAFCCAKCVNGFAKLSDAEKQAKVNGSMPQK